MVTNCFGNKNFMQPMRRLKGIFLLGLGGQGGFFCFYVCSHQVPQVLNVFPKMFPIAPRFLIPYCSAMVPLPFIQVVMGGQRVASTLVREAYLGLYVEECPHVSKILVMGQSNGSFWKKEKRTLGAPVTN